MRLPEIFPFSILFLLLRFHEIFFHVLSSVTLVVFLSSSFHFNKTTQVIAALFVGFHTLFLTAHKCLEMENKKGESDMILKRFISFVVCMQVCSYLFLLGYSEI